MLIFAVTNLAAPAAAVFGSQASSSTVRLSLRPSTPPAALISSTAIWAPFFRYGPMAAEEPLRGEHAELDVPGRAGVRTRRGIREAATAGSEPEGERGRCEEGASAPDRAGHDVLLPGQHRGHRPPPGTDVPCSPHRSAHTALCDIAPNPREWRWPCHALWCSRDRAVTGIGPRARTRQERGRSGRAGTAQCP